jgi:hypothetical protein
MSIGEVTSSSWGFLRSDAKTSDHVDILEWKSFFVSQDINLKPYTKDDMVSCEVCKMSPQ